MARVGWVWFPVGRRGGWLALRSPRGCWRCALRKRLLGLGFSWRAPCVGLANEEASSKAQHPAPSAEVETVIPIGACIIAGEYTMGEQIQRKPQVLLDAEGECDGEASHRHVNLRRA